MSCEGGSCIQQKEKGISTVERPFLNRRWSMTMAATLVNDREAVGCALALPGVIEGGGGVESEEAGVVSGRIVIQCNH